MKYNAAQQALIDAPLDTPVMGVAGAGTGKAQPLTEPVLTPNGYVKMGELSRKYRVLRGDKSYKILNIYDKGKLPAVELIFSDNATTICCNEHLWNITNGHQTRTVTTQEWLDSDDFLNNYYLPKQEKVEFTKKKQPINPYILGATLFASTYNNGFYWKNANLKRLAHELKINGYKPSLYITSTFSGVEIYKNDKIVIPYDELQLDNLHIPEIYKYGNIKQREDFLNGVLDTHINIDGLTVIENDNKTLLSDLSEIIRSLGIYVKQIENQLIIEPNGIRKLKQYKQLKPMEMRCIEVDAPDGLYITRDYITTHNTTTILARAKRALEEYKTGKILLITFTRAAANDIKRRIAEVVGEHQMSRLVIGTFHSVMANIIKENAIKVGLEPTFSVIDENSTKIMYRSILEEHFLEKMIEIFKPDKNLTKTDYNKMVHAISSLINNAQPEEILTGNYSGNTKYRLRKGSLFIDTPSKLELVVSLAHQTFIKSLEKCRITNTITYDHILFLTFLMIRAGVLENYKKQFIHMIVDEYQDTNALQDKFIDAISNNHLTVIGDLDQALYEFRGGRIELMVNRSQKSKIINLTDNYRSYQPILTASNNVISNNQTGLSIRKPLIAHKPMDEHFDGIGIVHTDYENSESRYIVDHIKYLLDNGIEPKDIAILNRSRITVPSIKKELQLNGIPVNDMTNFADFMKSDIMVDTLNFIKIYTNPKDIYAFLGIIDRPKRGIGPKAITDIETTALNNDMSVVDFVLSDKISELKPALQKKLKTFRDAYLKIIKPNNMTFSEMVKFIHTETGYLTWIHGLNEDTRNMHLGNLEILEGMIEEFEREFSIEHNSYSLFDISAAFCFEIMASIKEVDKDGIYLTTIHGSKGLEWDHVYIIGNEETVFPGITFDKGDIESERRLMYVAMTRARKALTITHVKHRMAVRDQKSGNMAELKESRFLSETKIGNRKEIRN